MSRPGNQERITPAAKKKGKHKNKTKKKKRCFALTFVTVVRSVGAGLLAPSPLALLSFCAFRCVSAGFNHTHGVFASQNHSSVVRLGFNAIPASLGHHGTATPSTSPRPLGCRLVRVARGDPVVVGTPQAHAMGAGSTLSGLIAIAVRAVLVIIATAIVVGSACRRPSPLASSYHVLKPNWESRVAGGFD